jgi:hypothetical protein
MIKATENPEEKSKEEEKKEEDPNFLYCHYVTFVEKDGDLWQLDGRIPFPQYKGRMKDSNLGVSVC